MKTDAVWSPCSEYRAQTCVDRGVLGGGGDSRRSCEAIERETGVSSLAVSPVCDGQPQTPSTGLRHPSFNH